MSGELHVNNIGKSYRQWGSEWRRMASWFVPSIAPCEEHWVLKDVSFSIGPGEAVGIIGQNGAGKSTLLKLITGTTRPSQGAVQLSGRVSAILELGMGFNPDLTVGKTFPLRRLWAIAKPALKAPWPKSKPSLR
jgi:lipopolysaccharide transport system ATP-binding protein